MIPGADISEKQSLMDDTLALRSRTFICKLVLLGIKVKDVHMQISSHAIARSGLE